MINYAKVGKRLYYVQMIAGCFIIAEHITLPILQPRDNVSNLPVQTICAFNNLSTTGYISAYIIENIGGVYFALSYFGIDTVFENSSETV